MKFLSTFCLLSSFSYGIGNPHELASFFPVRVSDGEGSLRSRDAGDISFTLPTDIATSMNAFLASNNSCPVLGTSHKHKRVPDDIVDCLVSDAEDIIDALGAGGPLAALFNQVQAGAIATPAQAPAFADEGTQQALSQVMTYAADTLPNLQTGISIDLTELVALTVFYIAFYFVFVNAANLASIAISQSFLTPSGGNCIVGWKPRCNLDLCVGQNGICTGTTYFKGCACDDKACPAPEEVGLICPLDCGGVDSSGKCIGDDDGNWRGCSCINPWSLPFYNADDHAYQDISGILTDLPAAIITTCRPMTGNTWTYGPAAELAVKIFCANPSNLAGQFGDQFVHEFNSGTKDSITLRATLLSAASENIILSQADCFSNFWNVLNCPRSGTNVYGGVTQLPAGGPILEVIPNGGEPNLNCDPPDPPYLNGAPSSYKVALNRDGMVAAYTDFCSKNSKANLTIYPPPLSIYGPFGGAQVPNHQNVRVGVARSFIDLPQFVPSDCTEWDRTLDQDTCLKIFGDLTDSCDTGTRTAKRGGTTSFACIEYTINGAGSTADIFRLHLHQQMVDAFSQLEWTMYDSRGVTVGGPSTAGTATGAPQDLGFHVDNPTNKDNTNIHMFYPNGGKFQWSTGWTGKAGSANYNKEYYCDDVLSGGAAGWTGWQSNGRNGFERQFDCYFRGWGNKDGDIIN